MLVNPLSPPSTPSWLLVLSSLPFSISFSPTFFRADDVSLVVALLDANPFFWAGASANPSANQTALSFTRFLSHVGLRALFNPSMAVASLPVSDGFALRSWSGAPVPELDPARQPAEPRRCHRRRGEVLRLRLRLWRRRGWSQSDRSVYGVAAAAGGVRGEGPEALQGWRAGGRERVLAAVGVTLACALLYPP